MTTSSVKSTPAEDTTSPSTSSVTSSEFPSTVPSSESPVTSSEPSTSPFTSSESPSTVSSTSSEATRPTVQSRTLVTSPVTSSVTSSESPSTVTSSESSVTSSEPSTSTPRVRLITGTPDDVKNENSGNSESTTTSPAPPSPTTTSEAPITSGNRGPPSIQPPPSCSPPLRHLNPRLHLTVVMEKRFQKKHRLLLARLLLLLQKHVTSLCFTVTCHSLATCESSTGVCICRDGFIGDGTSSCSKKSTADCISLPSLCAENAKCDNSTRSCECDAGYIGDGYVCSPHPQDCVLRDNLFSRTICQNRRCQCLPGFTGDGVKCVSIHERASNCSQCEPMLIVSEERLVNVIQDTLEMVLLLGRIHWIAFTSLESAILTLLSAIRTPVSVNALLDSLEMESHASHRNL
ncbi:hypothetical protein B9Z55_011424 [Caenorhabditis nigoni]|uniref:EGF-like domain-containing protein n=1 Tax=Caenorhabditis nigoni TaxID=1611254 RepID=A0A2G5UKA4_9PELO|nr:hypothetical protein B9Z55_011424 [Caenorhabditis nigoni]